MATEKKPARSTGKKSAAKKAEEKNIEEEKKKFQQKLIALKELAKSKKNVLELGEINNFLADVQLDEEKTEKVIDLLEASGVDVLRISDDKDDADDDALILELEESGEVPDEDEIENIDLSVPDGVSIDDRSMRDTISLYISSYLGESSFISRFCASAESFESVVAPSETILSANVQYSCERDDADSYRLFSLFV